MKDMIDIGKTYGCDEEIQAIQVLEKFVLQTPEGEITGRKGDYACKTSEGRAFPMRKELFEALFMEVWAVGKGDAVDVDALIKMMGSKDVKDNSDSLMGLAQEANRILSEFEKTCKTLENMHILPAVVRSLGAKYKIDVDTPLSGGIKPATDYHKLVFDRFNAMSAEDIGHILAGGKNEEKEPKKADE